MAKLTSFSDFVGGDKPYYNQTKPYIYVIRYIMGKDDYIDELKEYILNYRDEESDYEDDDHYDEFMERLKIYAEEENMEEIEEMILNYEDEALEETDDDDDNYEERMYNKEYSVEDDDLVEDQDVFDSEDDVILDYMETNDEIEDSTLSDKLKDFLKIDIEFEDLGKDEIDYSEFGDDVTEPPIKYADYMEKDVQDIDYIEVTDEEEIMEESRLNKEWIDKKRKEKLIDEIEEENEGAFINSELRSPIDNLQDEIPFSEEEYVKRGKKNIDDFVKKSKEKRPAYLDKLPLFVHTTDGKKPTKKQLENLVQIIKEEFPEEEETKQKGDDDVIKINGEYE